MASNTESYPPISEDDQDNNPLVRVSSKPKLWSQYLAAISATMGGLVMGTAIGWSGPALHLLRPDDNDHSKDVFPGMTDGQASFVASLMPAGALLGGNSKNFHCFRRQK